MDESEKIAEKYLLSLGLGVVDFEPDGNVPPDFSVGGIVAVEVRRLNQNYEFSDGRVQGLEETSIPLLDKMKKRLSSIGPSLNGECWYVGLSYGRPMKNWKILWPQIEEWLRLFMLKEERFPISTKIDDCIEIDLIKSGKDHGFFYVLGASVDEDSGGWVFQELERNLLYCVSEKEQKILPYLSKYERWWLVLVDNVAYGLDQEDRDEFRRYVQPKISTVFEKIVLLSPLGNGQSFEVR